MLWFVASAEAADYLVGSGQPYATVGAAVAAATADPGTGHAVLVRSAGPYTETVLVTESMTIRGDGVVPVLRSASAVDGFFAISGAITVTIADVEIDGQGLNRGVHVLSGSLVLDGVDVHDAFGPSHGGGLLAEAGTNLVQVYASTFRDSATIAGSDGPGIAMDGGALEVRGSTFERNTSGDDAGHIVIRTDSGADLLVEDCTFRDGTASQNGGALYLRDGDVQIRRSRFESNHANDEGGGAIYAEEVDSLLVEDNVFVGNDALGPTVVGGGAVYQVDGAATWRRNVYCENATDGSGGAFYLSGDAATVENDVFLWNTAGQDGGAVYVRGTTMDLVHASLSSNAAGIGGQGEAVTAETGSSFASLDSYYADHAGGSAALASVVAGAGSTAWGLFWANATGGWDALTTDAGNNVTTAPSQIPAPPAGVCDPLLVKPPAGSPLLGAASDGTAIGAFGGPSAWPDADGDGFVTLEDCDDADPTAFPGAPEVQGDGVDQDCDGGEDCFADTDGDGFGNPSSTVPSLDLDCADPGEAPNGAEACEGFDDGVDPDGDGVPTGCDPCPADPGDDSDGDGICDSFDLCPGGDDAVDPDGDGVPSACDPCPADPADDSDGDGVCDSSDVCPGGDDRIDGDGDGVPWACDPDDPGPSIGSTGDTGEPPPATGDTGDAQPPVETGATGDTGTPPIDSTGDTGRAATPPSAGDPGDRTAGLPRSAANASAGCGCSSTSPVGWGFLPALVLLQVGLTCRTVRPRRDGLLLHPGDERVGAVLPDPRRLAGGDRHDEIEPPAHDPLVLGEIGDGPRLGEHRVVVGRPPEQALR